MPESLDGYFDFSKLIYKENYVAALSEEDVFTIMDKFECLEEFKNDLDLSDNYIIWLCDLYKNFRI